MILTASLLVVLALLAQGVAMLRWRAALQRAGMQWRVWAETCGAFLAAAAGLVLLFEGANLDLEQHSMVLWTWVCSAAVLVGMVAAARAQRVPTLELALAALPALEIAAWAAFAASVGGGGLAAAPIRALLVAPAALALCSYFGASVGYLLWGAGQMDLQLGYEGLVGRRFLLSKASAVLSTVTTISVVGVSLGVWLVLVSLGILAGFENDLQRKIIGANAHVVLQRHNVKPFVPAADLTGWVESTPGVVASSPFVSGEVAIASYSTYQGALLFGIDPQRSPAVLAVLGQLEQGSLASLVDEMAGVQRPSNPSNPSNPNDPNDPQDAASASEFTAPAPLAGIVIGVEMAKGLNVKVGDRVRMVSPLQEVLTPLGPAPKSLGFRVAAIFSTKMYEYDARYVYVSLPAARRFLEIGDADVTGLQLRCNDPELTGRVGQAVLQRAGDGFDALDWKQRNQTLFSALKLERVVAFVVLVFIILVASFSIVNTLTMSVIEKRQAIAILKTMGARDVGIMKLFLVQGLLVGAFGTLIGTLAGVGSMKALERFGFWIPGEVYYIDSLPVKLETADVVLVVLAALLIVWDFAVFPALRGSQLEPVEGLRDG